MTNRISEADLSSVEVGGTRKDDLFDVLSHRHRRFILQLLQTAETPVSVEELTTELHSWESHRPTNMGSDGDRESFELSLIHTHLPKIADAGLITYDEPSRVVRPTDRTDAIQSHLQTVTSPSGSD